MEVYVHVFLFLSGSEGSCFKLISIIQTKKKEILLKETWVIKISGQPASS